MGDLDEHRHGQVEVLQGRVAPVPRRLAVVGRAEVGGGYGDGAGVGYAPLWVVHAFDLEACSAAEAAVEEGGAKGGGF